jgi:hypothetical protein
VGCPISKVIMQKVHCQEFTFPLDSNANLLDGEGELPTGIFRGKNVVEGELPKRFTAKGAEPTAGL